ncbi:hypothetical protein [Collinsella sp. AK_207A]|uniref:hypothetical protein n=1 Tax=Collinsella sp. AK_207A TaxID=2650472 RepID=UPI001260A715|nr:hypothetical protein [Collinsella sp. AK_207A]
MMLTSTLNELEEYGLVDRKQYYAVDPGMRRVAFSDANRDAGRLLENVVHLELPWREGSILMGREATGEVDHSETTVSSP